MIRIWFASLVVLPSWHFCSLQWLHFSQLQCWSIFISIKPLKYPLIVTDPQQRVFLAISGIWLSTSWVFIGLMIIKELRMDLEAIAKCLTSVSCLWTFCLLGSTYLNLDCQFPNFKCRTETKETNLGWNNSNRQHFQRTVVQETDTVGIVYFLVGLKATKTHSV